MKKPSCPKTNFLLPVHATFTSGSRFWGVPPSFKFFFLSALLIEGQTIPKNLPIPIPTSYFLYTPDSLPVCIFGGCHQVSKVSFFCPSLCMVKWCKKIPPHPNTNFLLPVHATFTSGFCFLRMPPILNFLSFVPPYISSSGVKKYLPVPIPTSYFLYTQHSLPVCVFGRCR